MRTLFFFLWMLFSVEVVFATDTPGLSFIQNKGQWDKETLYRADIHGGYMYLREKGFSFVFLDYQKLNKTHLEAGGRADDSGMITPDDDHAAWHVKVSFLNANISTPVATDDRGISYNYFIGSDPCRWGSDARAFQNIEYTNFYKEIDLRVYSSGPHGKYDFIVRAGGDPSCIQWSYAGANSVQLEKGSVHARTELADIIERKPYAYQWKNGYKVEVPVDFVLSGENLSYAFPQGYDACYDLVIDPILIFSAYSGSIQDNWGNTATYDSKGNTYSGGIVNAQIESGFPATTGAFQVFAEESRWDVGILKYDSSGSKLLYATYLGGNGVEVPQSLVVDKEDNLLILGATSSSNFPMAVTSFKGGVTVDPLSGIPYTGGADIFLAKLSENGTALLASTYFGGTKNDGINFISGSMASNNKLESPLARNYGDQLRGDIVVSEDNSIFIATNTLSDDVPAAQNEFAGGSHDALIARFTPNLEINWSRYIGGSKTDAAYSIKVRGESLLVAGGTQSDDLPGITGFKTSLSGDIDGWIAEVAIDGSALIGGTYLGTNEYDQVYFIDVNEIGEVYAFGQTRGAYPIQGNVYKNVNGGQFIHKLSADLKTSLLSTVIGSGGNNPNISPTALLVSDCNNLYLSGWGGAINAPSVASSSEGIVTRNYIGGSTTGLPTTFDGFQRSTSGNDFYFMVLSADASQFLYGTFLGGATSRTHVDGGTSRFDKQGIVYHAVCAGCGGNSDFPAVNVPIAHRTNKSQNCNNAVFKFDLSSLRARLQTNNVSKTLPGISEVCIPDGIVFQNLSSGGEIFQWEFGDGSPTRVVFDTVSFIHHFDNPGTYTVTLTAIDQGTCKVRDVTTKSIRVFQSQSFVQEDELICGGESYQLFASGGATYDWLSSDKEKFSGANPVVNPQKSTDYYVTIKEATGCIRQDTVSIEVIPALLPEFELERQTSCLMRPMVVVKNPQADSVAYTFIFDFGDGSSTDLPEAEHTYERDSVYTIKLIAQREFCVYEQSLEVDINTVLMPNVLTPSVEDGKNDVFTIQYGRQGSTPRDAGLKVQLLIYNRWGNVVFESNDYQYDWSGAGLASGVYYYEATIEGYATCKDWLHLIK